MLLIWTGNLLYPPLSYALTSGPTQPEVKGFQMAGVSDMVDLQSGQLKYNIPLLDIDGYPINLAYQSGSGMDDEASWVGAGWSLNPGSITRQVRGIPDDFSGDMVETDHYVKPKVTVGGRLTAKIETLGNAVVNGGGSLSFGVFSDNYTGIGAELGVNAGISFGGSNDEAMTAGLGIGVLSNTQSGVDVTPYVSLGIKEKTDDNTTANAGLTGSFGYNTRSGSKALTLDKSLGMNSYNDGNNETADYSVSQSAITFNTEPISPSIQVPYRSTYGSFSFDVGGAIEGIFLSGGGTGYENVRQVQTVLNPKPAFGFLYADRGKNNQDALMDFIREKDNPVIPELPDIAIPVPTPDIWSYSSQTGSGQFRLFRGGSGIFFDNQATDGSSVNTAGGDYGFGDYAHVGVTHYSQTGTVATRKWTNSNGYLGYGDFVSPNYNKPNVEHVYFRQIGEKNVEDQDMDTQLSGTQPLEVAVTGMSATNKVRNRNNLSGSPNITINNPIAKTARRPNRTVISYLTAAEGVQAALDKTINSYPFNDISNVPTTTFPSSPIASNIYQRLDPVGPDATYIHKAQHISEITATDDGGKKMVYGIPVYNLTQDEYSFAVSGEAIDAANNLVNVPAGISSPTGDTDGIDNYYHKEHKPPYASSFLLTAILSPDYVDRTNNGITDDDLGTAIKFNYSKQIYSGGTNPNNVYRWRTPYIKATLNRALLADPKDDKGSIIYGEKELWYIQSIESKTKIAYFITEDRRDDLGVSGWQNGGQDATNTQKRLRQIRLYSKANMTTPIKVVNFQYTYELCPGVPNSADVGGGKLTLTKVWFQYANASKGQYHPYVFTYNESTPQQSSPVYGYMLTDRWGIYKQPSENAVGGLTNERYPYTNQNKPVTDANSALWQLSTITLPTGGLINISYEAGDYAYVQDQKAMVMTPITALIASHSSSNDTTHTSLKATNGIRVSVNPTISPPPGDATQWFKNTYLDGSDYIYTKLCVKIQTPNSAVANPVPYDFVPTYCKVSEVYVSSGVADIMLTPITESGVTVNPMSISAWQRMKNEYPMYAYPGFDNRVGGANSSVSAAVSAIVSAARNLSELKENFYQKANNRSYADQVITSESFVKLTQSTGTKIGGPARVKKIQIDDTWNPADLGISPHARYGQMYTYTTTVNGQTVSSGVATYEPAVGNDENALKQPIPYIEHIKGAINNYFDLELPLGESFYPAPSVGYSKVTVNDIDAYGNLLTNTGSTVSEFYSARDYPVKVTVLPLIQSPYKTSLFYSLMRTDSDDELCLSQGYSFEVNDMQGKPKATTVYDATGAVISSTAYYYSSTTNGNSRSLNNTVNVVNPATMSVAPAVLGRDVDFFTDFREQEASNKGSAINVGGDIFPVPFWPFLAIPHFPIHDNNDHKLFRSACAVKLIQDYGILTKVVKTENGSTITTDNLAYDGSTGEALVTRTINEFNQPIYSLNVPAYWAYAGMGGAYQNLGLLLSNLKTNANGEIAAPYNTDGYIYPGDKIFDSATGNLYWVINGPASTGGGNSLKLITVAGTVVPGYAATALVKVVRSGLHNMLTASTATIVSLTNPIAGNTLQLTSPNDMTSLKVINASVTTYDESWGAKSCTGLAQNNSQVFTLAQGSQSNSYCDSGATIKPGDGTTVINTAAVWLNSLTRSGIWINQNTALNTGQWMGYETCLNISTANTYFFGFAADNGIRIFIDGVFADSTNYTLQNSYSYWHISPHYLTAGNHSIHVEFINRAGPATAGLEIYNNTAAQLTSSSVQLSNLNIIFTSASLIPSATVQSFRPNNFGARLYHYTVAGAPPPVCSINPALATDPVIDPYTEGFLGNWRPYQTKVYQQSRNYAFAGSLTQPTVSVKNAGYVNSFYSHWYLNNGALVINPNATRWVTANVVTLYDKYGQQLENMDALGRSSAAKFDFNGELPSAVASNAQNREIYAASFEDSFFTPGGAGATSCNTREFVEPSTGNAIKTFAVNTLSHSGNYCIPVPSDGFTMSTVADTVHQKTQPYLSFDNINQFITQGVVGLYPNDFEPYPGKKYIFDVWVNDGLPNDRSVNIALTANGNTIPLNCKAVVEGWKLIEGTIDLSLIAIGDQLSISFTPAPSKTVYVDDIRMFPFDALLKTYAYDANTMRLMAELDENAFATFYEYDDEGLLVRVKKETEKGVMTLKESRSTYRKITP